MEQRWYYFFNRDGLENLIQKEKIEENNLVICQELVKRKYTLFKSFSYFCDYFHQTNDQEKCFYELLTSNMPRKPYFDIDMKRESIENFDEKKMIRQFKKIVHDMIGKDNTILIFASHTHEKLSYHIIIDKVYLQNYREAGVFFDRICDKLDPIYKPYFDKSVYKSIQQFRIIGSHKFNKDNTKKIEKDLCYNFKYPERYRTNKGKFIYLVSCSLVGNISDSKVLCGFAPKEEIKKLEIGSACEGDVEDTMRIFYSKYSPDDFTFSSCKETNGNLLITLRRLNPTYCEDCKRIHQSENPFITVLGQNRNISFYCRRRDNYGGVHLGSLGPPKYVDLTKVQIPNIEEMKQKLEEENVISDNEIIKEHKDLVGVLEDISEKHIKPLTPKREKTPVKKIYKNIKTSTKRANKWMKRY